MSKRNQTWNVVPVCMSLCIMWFSNVEILLRIFRLVWMIFLLFFCVRWFVGRFDTFKSLLFSASSIKAREKEKKETRELNTIFFVVILKLGIIFHSQPEQNKTKSYRINWFEMWTGAMFENVLNYATFVKPLKPI